jgi:hypothetical protein
VRGGGAARRCRDSATVNADWDNGATLRGTPRLRRRDDRATHRLAREAREEAEEGRIAVGYRYQGYLRTTVHDSVESAQVQCVTAFRHTAGKSYPSPDRNGRAASCTCSRTLSCSSGGRDRRTGEADAAVSVR